MKPAYAFVAVVALVACKPKEVVELPAAPPVPMPPVAAAPPLLTAEGWGRLKIGLSHDEAVKALPGARFDAKADLPDWDSCHIIEAATPDGLWAMVENGKVTRISLEPRATGVATDRGIKVGDPAEKVKAAYPEGLTAMPHKYEQGAEYLTWWAKPQVAGVRYVIVEGKVATISAGGPSIEYVEGCS